MKKFVCRLRKFISYFYSKYFLRTKDIQTMPDTDRLFLQIVFLLFISLSCNLLYAQNTWVEWEDESSTWLSGVSDNGHEKDIAISDLNNDGWTDIIVVHKAPFSNPGPRQDLLLMNNGTSLEDQTATYAPEFISNPTDARDIFIGDFDGDGWEDVVIANTFSDQPVFYHNLGNDVNGNWLGLADESNARFPLPLNVPILQFCALWAGDIDNNGSPDIYFSNYGQNAGQGVVEDVLLMNDGNGYFTDESASRLGNLRNSAFGTSVEILDMDGDDDLDIVKISTLYNVSPWNSRGVFVLFNNGTGTFTNWQNLAPAAPYMFTAGDFDGNGLKDLYVVDDNPDYLLSVNSAIPDVSLNFSSQTSPDPRTVFFGGNCKMADLDKDGDLDVGIAGADVDIPPCQISGIRQFTMDRNDNGVLTAPYGPVNYPWNVSAYDFAFLDLDNDCFPDLFLGLCNGFQVFLNQSENETIEITGDSLLCGNESTNLVAPGGYINYLWSNNSNNQSITVNQANDYCVTVTKENGCTIEDCITVTELLELDVEITGDSVLCAIETTILNSEPVFSTYSWSTNETTPSILVNQGGVFCLTVTDDNGCTGTDCITVVEHVDVIVNISGDPILCFGETETLTADPGFTSYLWSNNETSQSISVTTEGNYCVTVTDQNGCTGTKCLIVEEQPEVSVNISGNPTFCFGETETLTADPGFSSYLWSSGETTDIINVSSSGDYCVTVTDANGCSASNCATVEELPEIVANISGNPVICDGETETLTVNPAFSSYLWSSNETTQSIDIISGGIYCVTVTDDIGCSKTICHTVTENPSVIVEINGESMICAGETTKLLASGGFIAYDWSNGSNTQSIFVNSGGMYCVTVTDEFGCTGITCFTVTESLPVSVTIEGDAVICEGETSELIASAGFMAYNWSTAESTENIIVNSGGMYCVTVTDEFGCSGNACFTVVESPPINASITGDLTICTGESSELFATAGFASYIWSNDETNSSIEVNTEGMYCVTITDINGCTAETCATVLSLSNSSMEFEELICFGDTLEVAGELFTESGDYEIILQNANSVGCDSIIYVNLTVNSEIILTNETIIDDDGSGSGSIAIEVEGGTPPFMAEWSYGEPWLEIFDLPAGEYFVVLTDAVGCTATFYFTVGLETSIHSLSVASNLSISPNPFSNTTRLSYELFAFSNIKIDVIAQNGQLVENLFSGDQLPGTYNFEWDSKNQAAGIYYFKIQIDGQILAEKVMYVK